MDDLSQKITEILGNPETMQQIQGLAGLLGQSGPSHSFPSSEQSEPKTPPEPSFDGGGNANELIGSEMLGTVMKLAPLLQSVGSDDDSTLLLKALKPFMHSERAKKIDSAIRLLGLMRMLPLLKSSGIEFFK